MTINDAITSIGKALPKLGAKKNAEQQALAQRRNECSKAGGRWDNATQTCVLPTAQNNNNNPKASIPKGSIEVGNTQNSPKQTAVLPDGRQFFGLNKTDVNTIAQGEANKGLLPPNTQPIGTAQAGAEQQAQIQRLTQLAQKGLLTPQEIQAIGGADVNLGQALGAGGLGVIPGVAGGIATGIGASIVGGAVTGAAAGSVVPGAGTLAVGALGAVTGFIVGVRNSIKQQQTGEFASDQLALTKGQQYLRSLITDTNQNPQNAPENIALFYQTLNMIDSAHMKTFKDSQENLNKFLGVDGTEKLAKFEVFDTTMRQYYITQFQTALAQPNPSMNFITQEDITGE